MMLVVGHVLFLLKLVSFFLFRVLVLGGGELLEFDSPETLLDDKSSHFYHLAKEMQEKRSDAS